MKTVLVVDDGRDIIKMVQANLETKGHKVISASNGIEAIEQVKKQKPDLIVLDVMMPGMSGYEVCEFLKFDPLYKDIPILSLTARNEEIAPKISAMMGVQYMQKPFQPEVFWLKVDKVL